MNELERLLALDAALGAAECVDLPNEVQSAYATVQDYLDKFFENNPHFKETFFEQFLSEQKNAVKKLAENPQVFGA